MEQLFRLTDLEARIPLNLNVLDEGTTPKVMSLGEALRAWLEHRKDVLVRRVAAPARPDRAPARSARRLHHRLPQPRRGDPHHPRGGRRQGVADRRLQPHRHTRPRPSSTCGCARCASSRRWSSAQEHKTLSDEKAHLEALLGSEKKQWGEITTQITELRKILRARHPARQAPRPISPQAPDADHEEVSTALIEREPITVILSEKGWIRAIKGHTARDRREGLQDRRPAEALPPRRDHRQAAAADHRRQGLHALPATSFPAAAARASRSG